MLSAKQQAAGAAAAANVVAPSPDAQAAALRQEQADAERTKQLAALKEKDAQERLDKRAIVAVGAIRKFLTAFTTLVEQERLGKIAAKNKPKGKKSKKKEEEPPPPPAKNGKDKRPKRNAMQEAWFGFFADMDERIFKAKRLALDDLYRGALQLSPAEQRSLVAVVVCTPAKALKPASLNVNQMSIKATICAVAHAHGHALPRASFTPALGLTGMRDRGCSVEGLLDTGFREDELLRAGLPVHEVAAACDDLRRLFAAGVTAEEVLSAPQAPPRSGTHLSEAAQLRAAGYTALELMAAGLTRVWELRDAGYSQEELSEAGFPADALTSGGFGRPGQQPLVVWADRTQPLQQLPAEWVPRLQEGTRSPKWRALLPSSPRATSAPATGRSPLFPGGAGAGLTRTRTGIMAAGGVSGLSGGASSAGGGLGGGMMASSSRRMSVVVTGGGDGSGPSSLGGAGGGSGGWTEGSLPAVGRSSMAPVGGTSSRPASRAS